MAKKKRKVVSKGSKSSNSVEKRIGLAWKNLILFAVLFVLSFIFYNISTSEIFVNFFAILSMILGVLAFAFLIVFLVLVVLRSEKR